MLIDTHAHIYPAKIAEKASAAVGSFYDLPMKRVGSVDALLEHGCAAGVTHFVVNSVATTPAQIPAISRFIAEQCAARSEPDATTAPSRPKGKLGLLDGETKSVDRSGRSPRCAGDKSDSTPCNHPSHAPLPDRSVAGGTTQAHLIGLGALHPQSADFGADVDLIRTLGLRGGKLHPDFQQCNIDAPSLYPLYELLAQYELPLLLHTGDFRHSYSHPSRLKKVLQDIPHLIVIAAHLGGWSVWDDALESLKSETCFVDTCSSMSFMPPEKARDFIRHYGAERVLWGTDFPMWDHADELAHLAALGLTDAETERICWKNAMDLYSCYV